MRGAFADTLLKIASASWRDVLDRFQHAELVLSRPTYTENLDNPLAGEVASYEERRLFGVAGHLPQMNDDGSYGGSIDHKRLRFVASDAEMERAGLDYDSLNALVRDRDASITLDGEPVVLSPLGISRDEWAGTAVIDFERLAGSA